MLLALFIKKSFEILFVKYILFIGRKFTEKNLSRAYDIFFFLKRCRNVALFNTERTYLHLGKILFLVGGMCKQ